VQGSGFAAFWRSRWRKRFQSATLFRWAWTFKEIRLVRPSVQAARAARKAIQDLGPTWGAYQHYGSGTTGLIPGARQ
jgi:hypothetical protein